MVEQGLGNCRGSEQRDSTREPQMNHLDSGKGIGSKLNVGDALKASQNPSLFGVILFNYPILLLTGSIIRLPSQIFPFVDTLVVDG